MEPREENLQEWDGSAVTPQNFAYQSCAQGLVSFMLFLFFSALSCISFLNGGVARWVGKNAE